MPKKNKTIEEIRKENDENIENFVQQLKAAGVKEKTIKMMFDDINEYQQKQYEKAIKEAFERMRKIILESEGDE